MKTILSLTCRLNGMIILNSASHLSSWNLWQFHYFTWLTISVLWGFVTVKLTRKPRNNLDSLLIAIRNIYIWARDMASVIWTHMNCTRPNNTCKVDGLLPSRHLASPRVSNHLVVTTIERLDQSHFYPNLEVPGIKPRPPAWEASTLEKSHLDSLLIAIRNIYIWTPWQNKLYKHHILPHFVHFFYIMYWSIAVCDFCLVESRTPGGISLSFVNTHILPSYGQPARSCRGWLTSRSFRHSLLSVWPTSRPTRELLWFVKRVTPVTGSFC